MGLEKKFIAVNPYSRKEERPQINDVKLLTKKLEKEEGIKSKLSRRQSWVLFCLRLAV